MNDDKFDFLRSESLVQLQCIASMMRAVINASAPSAQDRVNGIKEVMHHLKEYTKNHDHYTEWFKRARKEKAGASHD